ncbi:hypothetical protein JCM33374_g2788 [Metschnikowia sp. JCM 33374]|nr:hypothetical protein JCM33374_g2788 [Metschnikowia sp. JCM 33374]
MQSDIAEFVEQSKQPSLTRMKRSVSPLSGHNPETQPKKKRLTSVFSALTSVFSKSKPETNGPFAPQKLENDATDEDELPNSFVSRKRRMSIHDSIRRQSLSIPRTSVSGPAGRGVLESLYDSVKSQKQENDVDGAFTRLGPSPEEQFAKEISPSVHVPKSRVLPKDPQEEPNSGNYNFDYNNGMQPLVLDQADCSVYEDDLGNLVRPPFINLDPRERYYMLQMKKSMETSEFLQSRLKYMVDPDETTSVNKPNNKVDSSTQTHTKDYLHKSLNFNALRTKLALKNRRQKREKKGLGAFSGEFYYEPAKVESSPSADSKFQGVLGTLNKPQFSKKPEAKTEEVFPDSESRQNSSRTRASVNQRPGLENSLRFGKSPESLDDDYVQKVQNLSNVIKLKDSISEPKPTAIGPSSAFKFDIQKEKIDSIFEHRKQENDQTKESIDSAENTEESRLPKLGLFTSPSKKDNMTSAKDQKPPHANGKAPSFDLNKGFTFGANSETSKTSEDKAAPSFSFGAPAQEKKPDLFGASKPQKEETQPRFSFNETKKSTEAEKPSFSFGGISKNDEPKAPTFSFGANGQKSEAKLPAFSFGNKPETSQKEPAELSQKSSTADTNAKTPVFSFGGPDKSAAKPPAFSFGGEKKPAENKTPLFSFGKANEGKDSASGSSIFGEKTHDATDQRSEDKAEANTKTKESSNSGAIFGTETETDSSKNVPKFSFGKSSNPLPSINQDSKSKTSPGDLNVPSKSADEAEEPSAKRKAPGLTSNSLFSSSGSNIPTPAQNPKSDPAQKGQFGDSTFPTSFGGMPDKSSTEKNKKEVSSSQAEAAKVPGAELPKFSFGKSSAVGTEPSKFSFGQSVAASKETPKFSFGAAEKPKEPGAPSTVSETKDASKPSFTGLTQPSASTFSFGGSANPVSFGNQSSSSEPTPAPSFPFSNSNQTHGTSASTSSFSFGQSATADPASIFGEEVMLPLRSPFSSAPKPAVGFSFGNNTNPDFGGSRPATPSNTGFGFGTVNQNNGQAQVPSFGGFNNATAPSSVFGGPSRSVTPNAAFGSNQPGQFNNGQTQPNGFSFSNNAINGASFSSAPGSFGQASRESTPPAFGNPMGGVGAPQPGPNFTNRKIAQMRPRKRR